MPKKLGRAELLAVFKQLEVEDKIRVFENCAGTVSSSFYEMKEEFRKKKNKQFVGFLYSTTQSTQQALQIGTLSFGYGNREFDIDTEQGCDAAVAVGRTVVERLVAAGFNASWDVDAADGSVNIKKISKEALPPLND